MTVRLPANTYAVGVDLLQAANTDFDIIFAGMVEWSQSYFPAGCPITESSLCEPLRGFVGVVTADDSMSIPSFTARADGFGVLAQPASPVPSYPAVLDNLLIQVPEPATALLLGVGLAGLCWRGRRPKK